MKTTNFSSLPTPERPEELLASVCRESFEKYCRRFWDQVPGAGKLEWNWHMSLLCDELQRSAERVFKGQPKEYDTIFNISPGTSKSSICAILFPTWTWTRMPNARHIVASHTETLVMDFAAKARCVIQSELYRACFPDIYLTSDRVGYYTNNHGGDRLSCTVAGKSPMGFHAHFLIVDDPIDPKKAVSELELKNAADFMTQTLPSRKLPPKDVAVTFLIMQRLHERDPSGVLIEKAKQEDSGGVRHVCLPAEITDYVTPPELKDKYVDGLMDPRHLGMRILKEYRSLLGEYGYAGQFLQKPVPIGGGMFKDIYFNKREKAAPFNSKRIRYWDRASTQDGGCYTAGVLLAKDQDGIYYVEHVVRGQWEPDERNQRMRATALRDQAKYGPTFQPIIYVEAEGGSSGRDAWKGVVRALAGFYVREDRVTGDKDRRAEPLSCQFAAGLVKIVEDGTWDVNAYVDEFTRFKPEEGKRGRYKDQVDSTSGAFNLLANSRMAGTVRVLPIGKKDDKSKRRLRIVVCDSKAQVDLELEDKYVDISIDDPKEVMPFDPGLPVERISVTVGGQSPTDRPPVHLGSLSLEFADIDPEDYQETWESPISAFGKLPQEVMMNREHGKSLWSFLSKKLRDGAWVIIIRDNSENRSISLAKAICKSLRIEENRTIYLPAKPEYDFSQPHNDYIFDMVRTTREAVI